MCDTYDVSVPAARAHLVLEPCTHTFLLMTAMTDVAGDGAVTRAPLPGAGRQGHGAPQVVTHPGQDKGRDRVGG